MSAPAPSAAGPAGPSRYFLAGQQAIARGTAARLHTVGCRPSPPDGAAAGAASCRLTSTGSLG